MARRHLREAVPASDIVQRPDVVASVEELRLKHREEFSCLPDSHHAEFDAEVETWIETFEEAGATLVADLLARSYSADDLETMMDREARYAGLTKLRIDLTHFIYGEEERDRLLSKARALVEERLEDFRNTIHFPIPKFLEANPCQPLPTGD